MILNARNVKLGEKCTIDKVALVGYAPSRKIGDLTLVIGDGAVIRSGSVVYLGSRAGRNLETGHNVVIREQVTLGDDVKIWSNSVIDYQCEIGNNVKVHSNCYLSQLTKISDNVFLAPGVLTANEKYPTGVFSGTRVTGVLLEENAKVGMGSILLPGIKIGKGSIVGAGSIVTRDVPPGKIVYGAPARVARSVPVE